MFSVISTDPVALQLLAAQEHAPVLIALFDPQDQLQYANLAFRSSYGLEPGEQLSWGQLMQRNHAQRKGSLIQTQDFDAWLSSALSRRGKLPFRAFEADLCDGRWIWMTETVGPDGWMLCIASDITALKSEGRSVRQERDVALRAARTDELTGISNRAHIMELLEQHLEAMRNHEQPCAMVLLDLDHFKSINDRYGHQCGDLVLQRFARLAHGMLRRGDSLGRVGGEEFLILLPGALQEDVQATVERLLEAARNDRPLPEFPDFFCTFSAGLGMMQAGDCARTAYLRIDQALYRAKAAGRNQAVCVWSESETL